MFSRYFDTFLNPFPTKVRIGFMMVGHTHDDIDQMFSRFNVGLRCNQGMIYHLTGFMSVIRNSYTPHPNIEFLYGVRDWKGWLNLVSSHEASKKDSLHGHLRPHQFRFVRGEGGRGLMYWKRWAREDIWFPQINAPLKLLNEHLDIRRLQPRRRKWRDPDECRAVIKVFDICKQFIRDKTKAGEVIAEMDERLRRWQGMVPSNGYKRPGDDWIDEDAIGGVLVHRKKWISSHEDQVQAAAGADDDTIYQDDVVTDDEELCYQGTLHSSSTIAVTNKKHFVDMDVLAVNSFILLKISEEEEGGSQHEEPLCLGKVLRVDHTAREVEIHWYADSQRSFHGKQNPLMKAKSKDNPRKNVPYTDTQGFDSIVISEGVQLTKSGKIPKRTIKKAMQRVAIAEAVMSRRAME